MIVEAALRRPGSCLALSGPIAGDGPASARLAEEQSRGAPIRLLGRLDGPDKAVALRAWRHRGAALDRASSPWTHWRPGPLS